MPALAEKPADLVLAEWARDCADDPVRFVLEGYPWREPGPLQDHDGPDVWQMRFLLRLRDEVQKRAFDGHTPVAPIRFATSSGHGVGKLSPYSAVIDTPRGAVAWGTVRPGDTVFGADGQPTEVVARHEQGVQPIYRVTFDDGSSALVGLSHLWNVRGRHERRHKLDGWRTLSTQAILDAGVTRPNGGAEARQWEIPVQGAAQFPTAMQSVHPYVFGVWLGDGSKGQGVYTKPYPEIADRIRHLGHVVTDAPDGKSKYVQGLRAGMREEPVFQCGSHARFIPHAYKYADVEQRTELLRGLLDTDGEVHGSGSIGYSSTSEQLIDDVIWLVRSLGGKAQRQPTEKRGWYPDDDGQRVACRLCYRATIQLDWNPFTLAHRKAAYKPSEHRYLVRWMDSIAYSHDEAAMCITVAAPDGLYLTNDFIVTHNSVLVAWLVDWLMSTRPHCQGTVTANTFTQLETKTWAAIQRWTKLCLTGGWTPTGYDESKSWFSVVSNRMYHKDYRESWFCAPQSCREENSEAFAGQHAADSTSFYINDEDSAVPDAIHEVEEGGLTDGEPMQFLFGNATRTTGSFHQACFGQLRNRYIVNIVDSRESRFTNKAQIAEWIQDYGEDSDFVRVRVRGLPPAASDLQFIDSASVAAAQSRPVAALPDDPLVCGLDLARGGADECVFRFRRGQDARTVPPVRVPGEQARDSMQLVTKAADILGTDYSGRKVAMLFVDATGGSIGGPIADRLRQLGHRNVVDVQFGGLSPDPKYANMRAYMWAKLRDALRAGLAIDPSPALEIDLTGPGYFHDKQDRLLLESKEQMKKRGLDSPDDGDALALTFAQVVRVPAPLFTPPPARHPSTTSWMS